MRNGRACDSRPIMGLDPGLNITGYGLLLFDGCRIEVLEAGVLRMASAAPLGERLVELHRGATELLTTYRPQVVALEQLFSHYQRPRTAILMGHARGVLCLAAAQADVPVESYSATQVKRILTGSGRAPKLQVQRAVQSELRLAAMPEPPDVADALAVAMCHAYLSRTRSGGRL